MASDQLRPAPADLRTLVSTLSRPLGGIPHLESEPVADPYTTACNSWWTRSSSIVQRSVFMDDWAFSIAPEQMNVSHLAELGSPVASIPLAD